MPGTFFLRYLDLPAKPLELVEYFPFFEINKENVLKKYQK